MEMIGVYQGHGGYVCLYSVQRWVRLHTVQWWVRLFTHCTEVGSFTHCTVVGTVLTMWRKTRGFSTMQQTTYMLHVKQRIV
jgi:hypothetical protein